MFRILIGILFSSVAYASGQIHTWHDITTTNGQWLGRLVIASSQQAGFFADRDGNKKGPIYDFTLSNDKTFVYGFGFDVGGTDFDVSYTLTLYQQNFASKACVFNVSAKGPAMPDVRIEKFNGAECRFARLGGKGGNFSVS